MTTEVFADATKNLENVIAYIGTTVGKARAAEIWREGSQGHATMSNYSIPTEHKASVRQPGGRHPHGSGMGGQPDISASKARRSVSECNPGGSGRSGRISFAHIFITGAVAALLLPASLDRERGQHGVQHPS